MASWIFVAAVAHVANGVSWLPCGETKNSVAIQGRLDVERRRTRERVRRIPRDEETIRRRRRRRRRRSRVGGRRRECGVGFEPKDVRIANGIAIFLNGMQRTKLAQ